MPEVRRAGGHPRRLASCGAPFFWAGVLFILLNLELSGISSAAANASTPHPVTGVAAPRTLPAESQRGVPTSSPSPEQRVPDPPGQWCSPSSGARRWLRSGTMRPDGSVQYGFDDSSNAIDVRFLEPTQIRRVKLSIPRVLAIPSGRGRLTGFIDGYEVDLGPIAAPPWVAVKKREIKGRVISIVLELDLTDLRLVPRRSGRQEQRVQPRQVTWREVLQGSGMHHVSFALTDAGGNAELCNLKFVVERTAVKTQAASSLVCGAGSEVHRFHEEVNAVTSRCFEQRR